jgi:hypothetical protein
MFVCGIVIDDEVDCQVLWYIGIDMVQKRQEPLMSVPPPTLTQDRPVGTVRTANKVVVPWGT